MSKTEEDEKRLRSVEEAIIYFKSFVEIFAVDLKERVKALEKSEEANKDQMHISCETKTKEIDSKVKDAKDAIYTDVRDVKGSLVKMLLSSYAISGAMFLLFIGAIVYFNNQDGGIHEKINRYKNESVAKESENATSLKSVLAEIRYIRDKIDDDIDKHNQHKGVH